MAQVNQQRLDAQFPFDDEAGVQLALRLLTKVIEARIAALEAQRAGVDGVVDDLTAIALERIGEVLTPSLVVIQQLIDLGFPSTRITDSGAVGRAILAVKDQAEFFAQSGAASQADVAAALQTANQNIAGVSTSLAATLAKVNAITAGADPLLDTFVELVAKLQNDEAALAAVLALVNTRVRFDAAQGLSGAQQSQARSNIGAASPLGYTPVIQGTGVGMTDNTVRLGWDGAYLRAQVDNLGLGTIWTSERAAFNSAGYQKLPSGLIIQWGYSTGGDRFINFPVVFPNALLSITALSDYAVASDEAVTCNTDQRASNGFALRTRMSKAGVSYPLAANATYMAFGY